MDLTIDQALLQAIEAHKSGQLQDAERLYRSILEVQPKHADANHNLGVLAVGVGKPEAALPLLKVALDAHPEHGQFWLSYISALIEAKQFIDAQTVLEKGKRLGLTGDAFIQMEQKLTVKLEAQEPSQQDLNALLSEYNAGNFDSAEHLAKTLTQKYPGHPFGWKVLGSIMSQTGRLKEALIAKQQAVRLSSDDAEAHSNLGNALRDLGRLTEAEQNFREAIRLKPDFSEAHSNLGNTLQELGRLTEAEASCREAIRLKPDFAQAHCNYGVILKDIGQLAEAEASFRGAIRLRPDFAQAHCNLGACLQDLGRVTETEASYREAIRLKPDYAEALSNLGITLQDRGQLTEAAASYREAIRLKPDYAQAHSNLLFSLNYVESFSPDAALSEAKRYGSAVSSRATPKFTSWEAPCDMPKMRIGFVSGDLRTHPVGYFIEGLIQHLDKDHFDLYAFPTTPKSDDLTIHIKRHFHAWIPIFGKSDREAAALIHQQGIHVLIDLSGHTDGNRLPVFSYKPAPVQASWLGYFATTGLPEMDYFLGDPYMAPKNELHHFSEQIWNLPETWLCLTPPSETIQISPLPALKNRYITFGNFGNLSKMGEEVVKRWALILQCVPNSKLFLKARQLADAAVVRETQRRFANHDVAVDRLILEAPSARAEYLAAYNRVDMVLDTFPYPGGTTSSEALWMGVPVLTLKGDRFLSRLGESIARNAGQANWIAEDLDDYVNKAVAFTSDLPRLADMRATLRERVLETPLFDVERFARNFGEAVQSIFSRH